MVCAHIQNRLVMMKIVDIPRCPGPQESLSPVLHSPFKLPSACMSTSKFNTAKTLTMVLVIFLHSLTGTETRPVDPTNWDH